MIKPKIPIALTSLLLLGGGAFLGYKYLKRNKNTDGTSKSVAPSIATMTIASNNLTINVDEAGLMAQSLYNAMQGFGTQEDVIYSVFERIKTRDDLLLVIKRFGLRKNLNGTRAAFIGRDINLIGWLKEDLKESELAKIKPVFDKFAIAL